MIDKQQIEIVDWEVTWRCMLDCLFCYGPSRDMYEASREEAQGVVKQIGESGIKTAVLTGGEPLVRDDILDIMGGIHEYGVNIVLSTNAMLLMDYFPRIEQYLAWVGVPIDGSNPENTAKFRSNPEQFNKAIQFLDYSTNGITPRIRVGTVVSKQNKDDIESIGHIIEQYPHVAKWRLYEFCPRGQGLNHDELRLQGSEFRDIVSALEEKFAHLPVSPMSCNARDDCCLLIQPDLEVVTPRGEGYVTIGHLSNDRLSDLLETCHVNPKKIQVNRSWALTEDKNSPAPYN